LVSEHQKNGLYTISLDELGEMDLDAVYLEDMIRDKIVELNEFSEYNFDHNPGNPDHRFNLIFKNTANADLEKSNSVNIYSNDSFIYVKFANEESGHLAVYNLIGQELVSQRIDDSKVFEFQVDQKGYYLVNVNTQNYSESLKVYVK